MCFADDVASGACGEWWMPHALSTLFSGASVLLPIS